MDYINKSKKEISDNVSKLINSKTVYSKIIKAVIIIIIVIIVINSSSKIFNVYKNWIDSAPWILKGTKSAKKRMIISQDPAKHNSIQLKRSNNEYNGIEFSYVFWMFIDDWTYKKGEWKHVMHKGNSLASPLKAPGIWLHPDENKLRVFMNTFDNIEEHIDIDNIPINKWFNIAVCLKQQNLDIFFNGNLIKRQVLSSIPKQNYGDLYLNAFQGFSGYLSNMRYYNYYIGYSDLVKQLNQGPSMMPCVDSSELPPYLSPNWWINN
jgi:hypothetical protein